MPNIKPSGVGISPNFKWKGPDKTFFPGITFILLDDIWK